MKSKKLNERMRWSIRNRAINEKYGKDLSAIKKEEYQLAEEVYSLCYDKHKQAMEGLPKRAFNHKSYISVNIEKEDGKLYTLIMDLDLKEPRPIFYSTAITQEECKKKFTGILKKIKKYEKRRETLHKEKNKYSEKIYDFLKRVNTTKQLIELLPESESWLIENNCTDIPLADIAAEIRSS